MNTKHIVRLFNKGILGLDAAEFYYKLGYIFNIKNGIVTGIEKE